MKRIQPILVSAMFSLALAGCVSSTDPEPTSPPAPDADEVQTPEPTGPVLSTRLACEAYETEADDLLLSAVLDTTTYPLYDQYVDSDDAEPEAQLAILTGFFANVADIALITRCTYDLFEANACAGISTGSLEDGVLSWTLGDETSSVVVTSNDPAYSSGSIVQTSANGVGWNVLWSRADDGTETYERTETGGKVNSFVEAPDCSGTATFINFDDDGLPLVKTTTTWTSPVEALPTFVWEFCSYETGAEVCRQSQ